MPFNLRARQPRVRNGLLGQALVTQSAAGPDYTGTTNESYGATGGWRRFSAETRLIIRVPGHPPFFDLRARPATREKYAVIGMNLPVTVSEDLRKSAILWDEAPTVDEFMATGPPTFTDPDTLRAELRAAWAEVIAAHGGTAPQPRARTPIDGPNARIMALGHGGNRSDTAFGGKWEMLLSVAEPGRPRYGYRWRGKIPFKLIVLQGQDLPVEVSGGAVEIPWKRMPSAKDQRAALGDLARSLRAAKSQPDPQDPRTRLARIIAVGVEMPATIDAFAVGAWDPAMNGSATELSVSVEPAGGAVYPATFTQPLPPAITPTLAVGQRVTVRVARDDPQAVMLWNTPHAAGGADPNTGRPLDAPAE